VDEKIDVPREAGPLLLAQREQRMRPPTISSTTFDNTSLKEYFTRKGLLAGVDFDSLRETEIEPIVKALDQLDDKQRTDVEAEFRQVNEMACEMGVQVLIEEADSPFHNLDWS
jgi:hypothetical protein